MMQFTLSDLLWALLLGARWTVALSLVAFVCGGALGFVLMLCTISRRAALRVRSWALSCSCRARPC